MPAYAQPADLIQRFDARTVGNLISDNGETVEGPTLVQHPVLLALLATASGDVESALLQGERYSVDDLQNLTDNSNAMLTHMVCVIAFGQLWQRRPYNDSEQRRYAIDQAENMLEQLRQGRRVFTLTGPDPNQAGEAGVPKVAGPSRPAFDRQTSIVDVARPRSYPSPSPFHIRSGW
jgi:phage gp36-like protein